MVESEKMQHWPRKENCTELERGPIIIRWCAYGRPPDTPPSRVIARNGIGGLCDENRIIAENELSIKFRPWRRTIASEILESH